MRRGSTRSVSRNRCVSRGPGRTFRGIDRKRFPACLARALWHNHADGHGGIPSLTVLLLNTKRMVPMIQHRCLPALAGILVFTTAVVAPPRARAQAVPVKVRVVIIDGQNNHNWRQTTPHMKEVLEKSGRFTVDVSSNLKTGDQPGTV